MREMTVLLGVFNAPRNAMSQTVYVITEEKLKEQMDLMVGRFVGELEQPKLPGLDSDVCIQRIRCIDPHNTTGILKSYDIEHGDNGCLKVYGKIELTAQAEAKLFHYGLDNAGNLGFSIRALGKVNFGESKRPSVFKIDELPAFDFCPFGWQTLPPEETTLKINRINQRLEGDEKC